MMEAGGGIHAISFLALFPSSPFLQVPLSQPETLPPSLPPSPPSLPTCIQDKEIHVAPAALALHAILIHPHNLIGAVIPPVVNVRVRRRSSSGRARAGGLGLLLLLSGRRRGRRGRRGRRSGRSGSRSWGVAAAPPGATLPVGVDPFGVVVAAGIDGDDAVEGGGGEGGRERSEVEEGTYEFLLGLEGGIGGGVADGTHCVDEGIVSEAFAAHAFEFAFDAGAAGGVA